MQSLGQQASPDVPSPRRSLATSVDKLEQTAERMSMGSDIGAEIRKIWHDQKRQDGQVSVRRDSSVASSFREPSRQRSASSLSNSVDVNGNAYPSGLSPDSHTSPIPSVKSSRSDLRSRAYSNPKSNPRSPQPYWPQKSSGSTSDINAYGRSPYSHHSDTSMFATTDGFPTPQRSLPPISESAHYPRAPPWQRPFSRASAGAPASGHWARGEPRANALEEESALSVPMRQESVARSASNASHNTMHQAASLWRDFDGAHYSPVAEDAREGYVPNHYIEDSEIEQDPAPHELSEGPAGETAIPKSRPKEEEVGTLSQVHGLQIDFDKEDEGVMYEVEDVHKRVEIMPAVQSNLRWAEPAPTKDMVYYPAPVPMSLNMPKRLSQQPGLSKTAMRRSQVLSSIPLEARQSAVWLSGAPSQNPDSEAIPPDSQAHVENQKQNRQSALNFHSLPPQLRASIFFDHQPVAHHIEIKNGSAVATLDSLLDASARAPADHSPEDLDLSANTSPRGHRRGISTTLSTIFDSKPEASRSRLSLLPFKKFSSGVVSQQKRTSGGSDNHNEGAESDLEDEEESEQSRLVNDDDDDREGHHEGDSMPGADNEADLGTTNGLPSLEEQYQGAPNTLLAELQLRKQQLRSRNRTAVTAFPQGMHATLLELDAVEQIEKRRRQGQRTALAWDPPIPTDGKDLPDENVPLGVLFPSKHGQEKNMMGVSDWDRPLGLIAKRHYEDHEPLSTRRNRLRGIDPKAVAQTSSAPVADEMHSVHEDETLAQRTRRLRSSKALDEAIGELRVDGFADDMMSQFGGLDDATGWKTREAVATVSEIGLVEEETLGQRRRRLRAQAASGTHEDPKTAQLQSSLNVANLPVIPTSTVRQVPIDDNLIDPSAPLHPQRVVREIQASARPGYGMPFVGQQGRLGVPKIGLLAHSEQSQLHRHGQITQHNQHGYHAPVTPSAAPQSQSHMKLNEISTGGTFTGGTGHIQRPSMAIGHSYSRQIPSSGLEQAAQPPYTAYAQNPLLMQQSNMSVYGMPMMYNAQGMPMHPAQLQDAEAILLTSKQRANIDRWRQSVNE